MSKITVCLDCPNYEKGGWCRHRRKTVAALLPACDHAKELNKKFNPENEEATMIKLAPQAKTKTCTKCGRELPISEFYARTGAKDGLQTICKECHNAATKKCREDKKDKEAPIDAIEPQAPACTKKCPRCGRELPADAFGKHSRTRDNLQPYCRDCRSEARIGKTSRPGQETTTKYVKPEGGPEPQKIVVREALTDKQMVMALRAHGWTVTCTRTITEEL